MKFLGFILIVTIIFTAIILFKGATKIEEMILSETEQKGEK